MWLCERSDLFGNNKVVILLALLYENIFPADEVGLAEGIFRVGNLFLIYAYASALDHLAEFALGGEAVGGFGQQVRSLGAENDGLLQFIFRKSLKHAQQGSLIQMEQAFLGCLAEE